MIRNKFSLIALAAGAMLYRDDAVGNDGAGTAAPAPAAPTAPNGFVNMTKQDFHFKAEKIRDAEGKEVGVGKKLPKAELYLPVPKPERLVQILQGGEEFAKERELLMDGVMSVIYGVARGQINDYRDSSAGKDQPITQSVLNFEKLDWSAIANMPKAERGTSVPSDEDIKAFLDSYQQIMPAALEKSEEKIKNHVALFQTKFKKQRSQKELLEVFRQALGVYSSTVSEDVLEDHLPVVEYYSNMLDRALKAEEKITMDDI